MTHYSTASTPSSASGSCPFNDWLDEQEAAAEPDTEISEEES